MLRHTTLLAVCLFATLAEAAQPNLGGTNPRGAQRGTEVVVELNGARLEDAEEVLLYEPGIEVTKLEVVNTNQVKATFKIAADAEPGNHRLRVRTKTGISELRPFSVGVLPEVAEKEPNSEFSNPQPIAMNVTVTGVSDNEDVDYFAVDAKKGDRITVEVEGIRLGITMFDPYVAIMNAARFELASSDDAALVYQDGVASIVAPEDGKYIIQVRDSSYTGNGNCHYRAHIGNFPRPLALLPAGGELGEATPVKFLGDVLGEKTETITVPGAIREDFSLFFKDDLGIAPSGNPFRISEFGNALEVEPNDVHTAATPFVAPLACNGVIEKPDDVDHFKFTATKGQVFDIRCHARSIRSPLDPVLTLLNAQGGGIAANDDTGGPDSYLRFSVPADGEYILRVTDHLKNGSPIYAYRIEVTPVAPRLALTVNEFVQYVAPVVTVPKGARMGIVLSSQRFDFGGPLAFRGENLPQGVTIDSPGMTPGMSVMPIIFNAPADAPLGGKLADVVGALNDPAQPNLKVEGRVSQPIVMVRGQNQVPFRTEPANSLPVVVTDEVPFDIAVVEPKVPLVRNGQMNLKVVATRKGDFKAPIKVDMLWGPPGLGFSGSISIAEGQNEALIPMNAAGNAPLETWKIAIRGQAPVGNGTVEICSPFVNLRIAEMYLTLAYDQAAVEQGKETDLVVHMTKAYDFPDKAKITLLGLPNKATTDVQEITKDTKDIIFKIKTDATTPAGNHQNLFCQVVVVENGEEVTHNIGTGKLRVDVPLPPKPDAPPAAPMPAATPTPMPEAPKRLTRLEQLRLEQAEREKARKAAEANKEAPKQ